MQNLTRFMMYFIAQLVLLMAITPAHAAPVYKVEVLVFEHLDESGIGGEIWRVIEPETKPDPFNSIALSDGNEGAYQQLPAQDLNLTGVRKRLEGSENYRVILHEAWRQPALEKQESTPVWIEATHELTGEVMLHQGRYLHFSTDLIFNALGSDLSMKQRRRIKSKELHYFDHPKFGLLVRVVKL